MELSDFIKKHNIDLKAFERMPKRVFVLGRFNNKPLNDGIAPDLFLFTNRRDISSAYQSNFAAYRALNYSSFVDALKPRIAEIQSFETGFTSKDGIRTEIPKVELSASDAATEGDSYVINALNYFFLRGISTTTQKQIIKDLPDLPELIDNARGKTIYNQIRSNLSTFCSFQPRTVELIDAIAVLFTKCTGRDAIPPGYDYGEKLPIHFSEKLIDYLYDEDGPAEFQLDGLDFGLSPWGNFVGTDRAKKSRKAFSDIVTSFKSELLGYPPEFSGIQYTDGDLSSLTKKSIPEKLKEEFRKSKDAFNMLRQIMRSKVLLSMVVEWILADLKDLPEVRNMSAGKNQNRAIEKAILTNWEENALAKPIRRPNKEERRSFSLSMGTSFDQLMHAVLSDKKEHLDALSPELRALADELLQDEEKIHDIKTVSNYEDSEKFQAFKGALEIVFMDLISPRLYKQPGLDLPELKKRLRAQTMSAYLSAMMLSEATTEAFQSIVSEEFLEFFYERVDEENQTINDKEAILARLMGDVVDVMTQDEIKATLEEGIRVLNEIEQLKGERSKSQRSLSSIVPTIPNEVKEGSPFEEQKVQEKPAEELILETITSMMEQKKAEMSTNAMDGDQATATSSKQQQEEEATEAAGTTDSNSAEIEVTNSRSRLFGKLDEKINFILEHDSVAIENPARIDIKTKSKEVFNLIKRDESQEIVKVSNDLSSYQQIMHLIYSRYNENEHAKTFRNSVEGMTLMNLMHLFQDDLGFGKTFSNLYDLLIDLIINLNADDPEASPRKFLQENTLTKYFDDALFDQGGQGYRALMNTLKAQGKTSLENVVHFVSELRGVKYLMDLMDNDDEAEVIIVNATAKEFLNWLKNENLTPDFKVGNKSYLRFRAGFLVKEQSDQITPAGLVYATDLAFPKSLGKAHGDKTEWLENLKDLQIRKDDLAYVLPPIVLSTSVMSEKMKWHKEGRELAQIASEANVPAFVIGPSPRLNMDSDFPTILPVGYPFCVHYLSGGKKKQAISITGGAGAKSEGRFKVIGRGAVNYEKAMEEVIWGNQGETYCFAADYYLFLVTQLLATAKYKGYDQGGVNGVEFYSYFFNGTTTKDEWESSDILNNSMIGNDMRRFFIEHVDTDGKSAPLVKKNPTDQSKPYVKPLTNVRIQFDQELDGRPYSDFQWFEKVRKALDLP